MSEKRFALCRAFAHKFPMLARVFSAAVNGIDAYLVEVEVNCGFGDKVIVMRSGMLRTLHEIDIQRRIA